MFLDKNTTVKLSPHTVSSLQPDLTEEVKQKLEWFDFYEKQGRNARLTCRHFGISPDTFTAGSGVTRQMTTFPR